MTQILIVGAGPVGLTMAAELALRHRAAHHRSRPARDRDLEGARAVEPDARAHGPRRRDAGLPRGGVARPRVARPGARA